MYGKKETVAMLLAGGQGSRLNVLTSKMAKPAVPFGGKYRIIDLTLSNCVNSGIDTVGVLTQYQPLLLNEYIGNGRTWDLDRLCGGVHILPPYQKSKGGDWYKGTANAIYQNLHFIEKYSPQYVLILSGDHIYKANYAKMLDFHKEKKAVCTIAVIDVPLKEASRFGIMNARKDGRIVDFEEKPENPKSTKASMGIYIFNFDVIKKYLIMDEGNKQSSNDFGKDIIPLMINAKERIFAYPFSGYWKDVGTIKSLWEANMDLLGDEPKFPIGVGQKIYSRTPAKPPHYVGENAKISNSVITEGCEIYGKVKNSVIFQGVRVEEGASVSNSVIMDECVIGKGAVVGYSILGERTTVGDHAKINDLEQTGDHITVSAPDVKIGKRATIHDCHKIDGDIKAKEVL